MAINKELLCRRIRANFGFEPTSQQEEAIQELAVFMAESGARSVFLLKGYAGTGKTTLISSLVKSVRELDGRVALLAPTGRSAKVFSLYSGLEAHTIHKKIYRKKSASIDSPFVLGSNLHRNTLFLVDEASMISNSGSSTSSFGSGRLLDDLVEYVFSGENCRLLLLGDSAQLPPVGETESPALSARELQNCQLTVTEVVLKQVMRQLQNSGILHNATRLRGILFQDGAPALQVADFKFKLGGFEDVVRISGSELIDTLSGCYREDGIDGTIVLCRSNKRAIVYNNGIRRTILDREPELCCGDHVMVVKNNYYWVETLMDDSYLSGQNLPSFIANGDTAVTGRVRNIHEAYGFKFAKVSLELLDYDGMELSVLVLLDTLCSEAPSLTREESERLYLAVMEEYAHIRSKRKRMEALREDIYYNALQIKYAYAITCHKAQGGQWKNVFIDQGYMNSDMYGEEYYRWLYTALTRATRKVFLVNWPDTQIMDTNP